MRLAVACGQRAYDAVAAIWADAGPPGGVLSAPVGTLTPAVENRCRTAKRVLKPAYGRAAKRPWRMPTPQAAAYPAARRCWVDRGSRRRRPAPRGDGIAAKTGAPLLHAGPGSGPYALAPPPAVMVPRSCKALNTAFGPRRPSAPVRAGQAVFEQVKAFFVEKPFPWGGGESLLLVKGSWPRPAAPHQLTFGDSFPGGGSLSTLLYIQETPTMRMRFKPYARPETAGLRLMCTSR